MISLFLILFNLFSTTGASQPIKFPVPSEKPDVSQQSIDIAMILYDIKINAGTLPPVLDLSLELRGQAQHTPLGRTIIKIGPPAFESWGLLASTLAHEIEVHANQNVYKITLLDMIGKHGSEDAEREAYGYELKNAKRFGLTRKEYIGIWDTVRYYYPEESQ